MGKYQKFMRIADAELVGDLKYLEPPLVSWRPVGLSQAATAVA